MYGPHSVRVPEASSPGQLQVKSLYNPFQVKNIKSTQHFSSSHMTKIPAVKDYVKIEAHPLLTILFQVPEK